ncbi:hypothetical protein [Mycobacteroides salmoniphilum]|uniref:hypothetical protein n=1 Tax=Mycobacteroides salmoniphilum TaxID=404941 RepID=UPI0012FFA061|nr:hypothetical protein [Mycobacteroides salmoniphilum]
MKGYPLDDAAFLAEVAWLRTFNMNDHAVARRLGMSVNTLQKRYSRARAEGLVVPR